jgi:hypothetical protein
VADDGLGTPAVRAADGGRRPDDRLHLRGRPRVDAVAEVLALEAVEVPVAVRRARRTVVLMRGGGPVVVPLVDDRGQHRRVAAAGVVGAAVGDEVDFAVAADDAVAERTGKLGVAGEADGPPGALVVAVVSSPAGVLDDLDAFGAEGGYETIGGKWCCHAGPLSLGVQHMQKDPSPGG